ncbi:MAG: hypothetical protein HDR12_05380, partial [Lachnospiraceae bacterium]|nr:hypothetical protein [Lachnospiraceae bacterium]
CSTEETPESTGDAPIELTAPEQSVIENDDVAEPDDASDDVPLTFDLNRNGKTEEVCLIDIDDGQGQDLQILENNGLLFYKVGYFVPKDVNYGQGSASMFLCTLDGEDYLLNYQPAIYQGVCIYSYELFTLVDYKKTTVQRNRVYFDINFGSGNNNDFDPEAIAAFMDEVNDLLSHSVQILNTDINLLDTFEKEGRLYDSLWWLDDWNQGFIRDESKSLLENLEDFRSVMTAVQEPVILSEAERLPITEPLEMIFSSGVGGWSTCLTLNQDGSFVGDYQDTDADVTYVCQFHGKFRNVKKLSDASWLLILEELELDTGHDVDESWDETYDNYTIHYISSDPYGFDDDTWATVKPGAQFILYSPEATGHELGTELYGAREFQSWMHGHKEFISADDTLGCWGLQNMETGQGFFGD